MDNKIGTITYSIANEHDIIEVMSDCDTGIVMTIKPNSGKDSGYFMELNDEQAAALGRALLTMVNGRN